MKSLNAIKLVCLVLVFLFSQTLKSQNSINNINSTNPKVDFTSSNLPIFVINTLGQTIISEYKKEVELGVIYNGEDRRNNMSDPFNEYDGKIGIEIRGSSSQMFPKKQYGFETRNADGTNLNVPLLGFPEENDWILYAPYSDKTLLRNVLAYKLFNEMGSYASRTKFCELVIDGEYMGVYVLMEKIKRDDNRVDISRLEPSDTSQADITGGYIIKIDKWDGENNSGWESYFLPFPAAGQKIFYQYHYPKADDITDIQKEYIENYIYEFETSVYFSTSTKKVTGYLDYINFDTVVDYFLLNEITKNVDAYRLSLFMFKDRDSEESKLNLGPIWDYNLGFGNADYYQGGQNDGWELDYLVYNNDFMSHDNFQVPFWFRKFREDTFFQESVYSRWQEVKSTVFSTIKIFSQIDSLVQFLDEAQKRNFLRWPILGEYIWPNYFIGQTYQEEVSHLKNWIAGRINWIDYNMFEGPSSVSNDNIPNEFILSQNYPNPFNPTTTISYNIPLLGGVRGGLKNVRLIIYNTLGQDVATLVNKEQKPGKYKVKFDASNLPSGVYIYRLTAGDFTQSKKMVLLR